MFGWGKKKRQEIDDLFGQFLHPELVEAMKSPDFNPPLNTFREVRVGLIFVAIDGTDASEVGKTLGLIADTTRLSGWYIDCMLSNLVVLTDGAPWPAPPERASRSELVAKLREQFGQKIKLLHGDRVAPWGSYGGRFRRNHGAMLFDFLDILGRLHAQPYGSETEIAR